MTKEILIRYSELALKSPSVRKYMETKLSNNIKILFEKYNIEIGGVDIKRAWGRLLITFIDSDISLEDEKITQIKSILSKYGIGIKSFSVAIKTSSHLEDIKKMALEIAENNIKPNSTFAVRARRIGKHDYNSKDLERIVGEVIYLSLAEKRKLSVNLTKPDYTLFIEVKEDFAYIFDHKISCFGGFPQTTQGFIGAIFRGSVEDAIAAFLLAKRGSFIFPILFEINNNKKISNTKALQKQLDYFNVLQPRKNLNYFKIDFNLILDNIGFDKIKCSICDEICVKITNKCLMKNSIDGISLGNTNTALTDRKIISAYSTIKLPIYYPLISISKEEINHPFGFDFKNEFCLESCSGFNNEKKKKIKSLSQAELDHLVTKVTSNFDLPLKL